MNCISMDFWTNQNIRFCINKKIQTKKIANLLKTVNDRELAELISPCGRMERWPVWERQRRVRTNINIRELSKEPVRERKPVGE